MEQKDVVDELMPDPEEEGGTDQDIEIEIADDTQGGGVVVPDEEAEREEQDAGAALEHEDDEELSPEDKKYSKNVQDRILREKRLRKRLVAEARAEAQAAENRARTAVIETTEARLVATSMLVRGLESRIGSLTKDITAAKEAGKTEDEVRLQKDLNGTEADLREAKVNHQRLEEAKKNPPAQDQNPHSVTWLSKNTWFSDVAFAGDAAKANDIDRKMMAEGKLNPRTPEYFKELDRRLHLDLPRLRSQITKSGHSVSFSGQKEPGTRRETRPSSALPARERQPESGQPKSKTKVVLTKTDLANMVNFKLDPANPKHQVQYARELLTQQGE